MGSHTKSPMVVAAIRASPAELERWRGCARARGLSLSRWVRVSLGEQADLDETLGRLESEEAAVRRGRVSGGEAGVV